MAKKYFSFCGFFNVPENPIFENIYPATPEGFRLGLNYESIDGEDN